MINWTAEVDRCFAAIRSFEDEEREACRDGRHDLAESAHTWRRFWLRQAIRCIEG